MSVSDGYGPANARNQLFNSRLFTVAGDPSNATFGDVPGYPQLGLDLDENRPLYYGFATLAVGERLYQFLSTINKPFHARHIEGLRFVGAKLIFSPDNGRTWRNQDGSTPVVWEDWDSRSRDTIVFFEEPQDTFSQLSFLQMGSGYTANTDGYVYVYSPNGNTDGTANELVMFRVPQDRILDRRAYEYFVEVRRDGSAAWTRDIGCRGVVHTFPSGWVNKTPYPYAWHPSVVYNAPLGLYMIASWGMGSAPDGMWFDKPSYLGLWIAADPWGPWEQIHEEAAWTPGGDTAARAYRPEIAPKWIADDGSSFWLVWNDYQSPLQGWDLEETGERLITSERSSPEEHFDRLSTLQPHYAFNVQRVDLTLS